jgi:hypothetical protein
MKDDTAQPWFFILVLALLGVGGTLLSGATGGSHAPRENPASSAAEPDAPPRHASRCEAAFERAGRDTEGWRRTLIVTVPDPIDSTIAYGFDRALDMIRRAAAEAGYAPDRSWLPWSDDRAARAGAGGKGAPCRQVMPGRMLFDRSGEQLQVLLVGETVSVGVHEAALRRALDISDEDSDPTAPILIAGPTFSGSAPSLRRGIEGFARAEPRARDVRVITGSATRPGLGASIATDQQAGGEPIKDAPGVRISFNAAVPDDEQMLKRFTRYLVDREILEHTRRDRVRGTMECFVKKMAVLVETGTAYGSTITSMMGLSQDRSEVPCAPTQGGEATARGATCSLPAPPKGAEYPACADYVPTLLVQYPYHIARLRTAYEQQHLITHEDPQRPPSGAATRALEMPLDRAEEPSEGLPTFWPMTPQSEDLMLDHALSEMCRQEMRWVGIIGTDTLDSVFLARRLKQICKNVRVFFLEADVLYTHPDHSQDLDGSVVVSSYPLLQQNRAWSPPFDVDTIAPFGSFASEGLYNAILLLLDKPDRTRELTVPFLTPTSGRAWSDDQPVWLTAIGGGNFWPLAEIDADDQPGTTGVARPLQVGSDALWAFNAPGQWRFTFTLLTLLAAAVAVGYWGAQLAPAGRRLPWGLSWAEAFPAIARGSPSIPGALLALLCLAPVTFIYGVAATNQLIEKAIGLDDLGNKVARSFLVNLGAVLGEQPLSASVVLVIMALLLLATADVIWLWIIARAAFRGLLRVSPARVRGLAFALDAASLGALLAAMRGPGLTPFAGGAPAAAAERAILFRERSGNLASGVSILVPAALLAGALFVCGYLGLTLSDRPRAGLSGALFAPRDEIEVAGGEREAARLERGLRRMEIGWAAVAIAAPLLAWAPCRERVGTLEGPLWDRLIWWATLIVLTCASGALLSCAVGWRRLRAVLHRYASLPMAEAFDRLPDRYARQLAGLLLSRPPDYHDLSRCARQLREVTDGLPREVPPERAEALARAIDAAPIEATLAGELRDHAGRISDATTGVTYAALCSAAGRVAEVVIPLWREPEGAEAAQASATWRKRAEALLATLAAAEIFHALSRLRRLLMLAIGALVLLLAMVTSYPFEVRESLLWVVEAAMAAAVGVALVVSVEMEKDDILSRVHRTTSGQVNLSRPLLMKVVMFAVLPLFTMTAAAVPSLSKVLFGWIAPLLNIMQ